MNEKPKSKFAALLQDAIGFDETDLEANALGKLSERQRMNIRTQRLKLGLFFTMAMLGCGAVGFWQVEIINFSTGNPIADLGVRIVTAGIFIVYLSFATNQWQDCTILLGSAINGAEGTVKLDVRNRLNLQGYSVSIGEMTFFVEKPIFLAFKNGDPYRIYYAPGSNTILSAEWLRNE